MLQLFIAYRRRMVQLMVIARRLSDGNYHAAWEKQVPRCKYLPAFSTTLTPNPHSRARVMVQRAGPPQHLKHVSCKLRKRCAGPETPTRHQKLVFFWDFASRDAPQLAHFQGDAYSASKPLAFFRISHAGGVPDGPFPKKRILGIKTS